MFAKLQCKMWHDSKRTDTSRAIFEGGRNGKQKKHKQECALKASQLLLKPEYEFALSHSASRPEMSNLFYIVGHIQPILTLSGPDQWRGKRPTETGRKEGKVINLMKMQLKATNRCPLLLIGIWFCPWGHMFDTPDLDFTDTL